jgi:hypothetical protein
MLTKKVHLLTKPLISINEGAARKTDRKTTPLLTTAIENRNTVATTKREV